MRKGGNATASCIAATHHCAAQKNQLHSWTAGNVPHGFNVADIEGLPEPWSELRGCSLKRFSSSTNQQCFNVTYIVTGGLAIDEDGVPSAQNTGDYYASGIPPGCNPSTGSWTYYDGTGTGSGNTSGGGAPTVNVDTSGIESKLDELKQCIPGRGDLCQAVDTSSVQTAGEEGTDAQQSVLDSIADITPGNLDEDFYGSNGESDEFRGPSWFSNFSGWTGGNFECQPLTLSIHGRNLEVDHCEFHDEAQYVGRWFLWAMFVFYLFWRWRSLVAP